jgi:hypothetical protein
MLGHLQQSASAEANSHTGVGGDAEIGERIREISVRGRE